MPESFEPLSVPFSTAEAERPVLTFWDGQLRVRFFNWWEREVILNFQGVVAFSWDDGDACWSDAHRDDSSYTVAGSEWIQRHLDVGTIMAGDGHRHYKLCFNAVGILQVISTGVEVLA
jgi:hypothetical protein